MNLSSNMVSRVVFTIICSTFGLSVVLASNHTITGPAITTGRYVFAKRNTDCFGVPRWDAATAYTGGQKVTYQNKLYRAVYWNQGQVPPNNIYPNGAWVLLGDC